MGGKGQKGWRNMIIYKFSLSHVVHFFLNIFYFLFVVFCFTCLSFFVFPFLGYPGRIGSSPHKTHKDLRNSVMASHF